MNKGKRAGRFTKGGTPWNKGLTGIYSPESRLKMSIAQGWQVGDKNPAWKGDNAGLVALQRWMQKHIPKPAGGMCPICKWRKIRQMVNVTGILNRDPKNWQWRCHYRCNEHTTGYRFAGTLSDHLCKFCRKPTKYSTRPPYGPNIFHSGCYAKAVSKEGFNCVNCADKNWLVECKCLKHCGIVFALRDKEGRKREYINRSHAMWGKFVPSIWKENISMMAIRSLIYRKKPRPKKCETATCDRPAGQLRPLTYDKSKLRDPRYWRWLCNPHAYTDKDG